MNNWFKYILLNFKQLLINNISVMKIKKIVFVVCLLSVLTVFGQSPIQKNIGVTNKHFHDLNIEPMEDGTSDFIVAGNLFDNSMQNEQLTLKRVNQNGVVIWINTYSHPSYQLIRGFDIAINNDLIVATGSVDVNGVKKVFIITINATTGVLQNGMYYDIISTNLNSRGLHIIYTESDADGDNNPDPGYVVGGFYSDCYSVDPNCINLGFIIRTDSNLNLLWTNELDSTIPNGQGNYDFINHITETANGFFITGSATDSVSPLQTVLALKIDFMGNLSWDSSYLFGNSRDVSVDAYYDTSSDIIYMLCNYSQAHYFGITVLDNTTGSIGLSNSWVATSGNNFDVYGFTLLESLNSSDNLVVVGYDKEENWIDNDGTSQFGQNNLFVYEFNKNTGNQVPVNYQYLVPHIEPIGDEFNFWNFQLPLIYYPDISFIQGTADGSHYYHVGYRTEPPATFSETELIKTTNDKLNNCEQIEILLTTNPIGIQNVPIIYGPTPNTAIPFEPFNSVINYTSDSCDPNLSVGDNDINEIIIYPNPADDLLYLFGENILRYKILDYTGKIIKEGATNQDTPIKIGYLKSGIYLIEIASEDNLQVVKLIKE